MNVRRALSLVPVLALALAAPAAGQADPPIYPGTVLELNAHGGLLRFDVEGLAPSAGGRLGLHFANNLGIAAAVDWSRRSVDVTPDLTEDATAWFYVGELNYTIPSNTRANFVASIGVGAARFEPPASLEDEEAVTELVIPVGLGLLWWNHGEDPGWAFRVDFRDHIVRAEEPGLFEDEVVIDDDTVTNNYELSIGLSLLLGR